MVGIAVMYFSFINATGKEMRNEVFPLIKNGRENTCWQFFFLLVTGVEKTIVDTNNCRLTYGNLLLT